MLSIPHYLLSLSLSLSLRTVKTKINAAQLCLNFPPKTQSGWLRGSGGQFTVHSTEDHCSAGLDRLPFILWIFLIID